MTSYPNRTKSGFTLVETLVAISILLVAVTGPLVTAARSVTDSRHANDQIAAYYLGQEGIEVVRVIRDNNSLAGNDWLAGIPSDCTDADSNPKNDPGEKRCYIDAPSATLTWCGGSTCPKVQYADAEGVRIFRHSPPAPAGSEWQNSIFSRYVTLTPIYKIPDPINLGQEITLEATITVRLEWNAGSNIRTFTLSENIFNWK